MRASSPASTAAGQPVTRHQHEIGLVGAASEQRLELGGREGAAGGQHGDRPVRVSAAAGFRAGSTPITGSGYGARAQQVDGRGRRGVAGDDQALDAVLLQQVHGDGQGAVRHEGLAFLAVGRVAASEK
jgi:hypothetical protein